jgi:hypothetical protein
MHWSARAGIAVGLVVVAACGKDKSNASAAQEEFSKTYSCPAPSVSVTPRSDLKAYDLQVGPSAPLSEVAADPARLAEWNKRQADVKSGYDRMSVLHASGCGHAVYYVCSVANTTNGQYTTACSVAAHPPK